MCSLLLVENLLDQRETDNRRNVDAQSVQVACQRAPDMILISCDLSITGIVVDIREELSCLEFNCRRLSRIKSEDIKSLEKETVNHKVVELLPRQQ